MISYVLINPHPVHTDSINLVDSTKMWEPQAAPTLGTVEEQFSKKKMKYEGHLILFY